MSASVWKLRRSILTLDVPRIMGILNLTPDSFSDGGKYFDPESAVRRAQQIEAEGADLLDLGAESTRPGAVAVGVEEEWTRLAPVLRALKDNYSLPISVDTRHSEVARRALEFPVDIINDVSCAQDMDLLQAVAKSDAAYVLMHTRGNPAVMVEKASYGDVILEVQAELKAGLNRAFEAGIEPERICLDPGFGFAKTPEQSWKLLENFEALLALDFPWLVGLSRKRMVRERVGEEMPRLDQISAQLAVQAAKKGAGILRVHDVTLTLQALASH